MTQLIRTRTRDRIYARDTPAGQKSPACTYCGRAVRVGQPWSEGVNGEAQAVLDHIIPISNPGWKQHKGKNSPINLVAACRRCNEQKGERDPDQWEAADGKPRWRARSRPEPAGSLFDRAVTQIKIPLCTAGSCLEKVEDIGDLRAENAYEARRRARARGR